MSVADALENKEKEISKVKNDFSNPVDYTKDLLKNVPGSGLQFVKDITRPFYDPVGTVQGLYTLTKGLINKAIPGEDPSEEVVDMVAQYYVDRYGGVENALTTLREDPVGAVSDVALLFTGGGALVKGSGVAGKINEIAEVGGKIGKFGRAIDPASAVFKTPGAVFQGLRSLNDSLEPLQSTFGATTGSGKNAVNQAFQSGKQGGELNRTFLENLRDKDGSLQDDVIERALKQLEIQKNNRNTKLKMGKLELGLDEIPLDPKLLDRVKNNILVRFSEDGYSTMSRKAQRKFKDLIKIIEDFQKVDSNNTVAGFDALKRKIQAEYPGGIKPGDRGAVVTATANEIKDIILREVPEYGTYLGDYSKTTKIIEDLEKTLGLDRADVNKISTMNNAFKKMSQGMRDGVNTNFGGQAKAVDMLGDPSLNSAIAGQSLSTTMPTGLQRLTAGGLATGGFFVDPMLPLTLPAFSPRLVGEGANLLGRVSRRTGEMANALNQNPIIKSGLDVAQNYGGDALRFNRPLSQSGVSDFIDEQERIERSKNAKKELLEILNK